MEDQREVAQTTRQSRRLIAKSTKLADVCYEIRGPVMDEAKLLEARGESILRLNIGNPAPFGYLAPDSVLKSIHEHLEESQGYADSQGIRSARTAVAAECKRLGIAGVAEDDIYLGNGVSELIVMSMQGLLNEGDEVLVPAPDYPLWTAAIRLAGGIPVHYRCDEQADWYPDLADVRRKTTRRTVGLVVINPNNPTGAVYERALLADLADWSRQNDLVLLADEIYSKITYDDHVYTPCASLADDVLTLTFDGLSKAYRAAGFRSGWMVVTGPKSRAADYIEGLNTLAAMRLCANVPSQHAIPVALSESKSIYRLTAPNGPLYEQRELAYRLLSKIDGISCVKPRGALYLFPRLDTQKFNIHDDEQFVLELLHDKHIHVVQGTGFGLDEPTHFRVVFLPQKDELTRAISAIGEFLQTYRQR